MNTLGADPEFFIKRGKQIIPICGLVGGTKKEPIQFPYTNTKDYKYQEDGAAFEFNIPPASSEPKFIGSIQLAREMTTLLLQEKGLALDTKTIAAASFSHEMLRHPLLQTIGCSPDYDGFNNGMERPSPTLAMFGNQRFVGGHLHFGYDVKKVDEHIMAQLVDLFVYSPFLEHEPFTMRSEIYGVPGVYRPKPYGIEYRRFSNMWALNDNYLYAVTGLSFWLMREIEYNLSQIENFYGEWDISEYLKAKTRDQVYATLPKSSSVIRRWWRETDRMDLHLPPVRDQVYDAAPLDENFRLEA